MNQILKSTITEDRIRKYIDNSEIRPPHVANLSIFEQAFIEECLNRVDDPFKVITVADVAKDLHCNQNTANEIFRRADFPTLQLGRCKKVTYLAYILWKVQRKEK